MSPEAVAADRIRDLIEKELTGEEMNPDEAVGRIIDHLRAHEPEVLDAWLEQHARRFLRGEMTRLMNSVRSQSIYRARNNDFATAVESGDLEQVGMFATWYEIDEEHTRKRLSSMTGTDHAFVAGQYDIAAKTSRMRCQFHRALAKKVGNRATSEVMSEEECERLLQSIQPA